MSSSHPSTLREAFRQHLVVTQRKPRTIEAYPGRRLGADPAIRKDDSDSDSDPDADCSFDVDADRAWAPAAFGRCPRPRLQGFVGTGGGRGSGSESVFGVSHTHPPVDPAQPNCRIRRWSAPLNRPAAEPVVRAALREMRRMRVKGGFDGDADWVRIPQSGKTIPIPIPTPTPIVASMSMPTEHGHRPHLVGVPDLASRASSGQAGVGGRGRNRYSAFRIPTPRWIQLNQTAASGGGAHP